MKFELMIVDEIWTEEKTVQRRRDARHKAERLKSRVSSSKVRKHKSKDPRKKSYGHD